MKTNSLTSEYRKKHYTGLYGSWYAMKQRCLNANNHAYKNYGGRGITFQESWSSFKSFREDMGNGYKKGLTIERIDNSQGYSKMNCRWATRKEQANNKRSNIILSYKGKKLPLALWANEIGVDFGTIRSRFYRGMKIEEVLKSSLYRPAKLLQGIN